MPRSNIEYADSRSPHRELHEYEGFRRFAKRSFPFLSEEEAVTRMVAQVEADQQDSELEATMATLRRRRAELSRRFGRR